jgi:hypothetical protein
MGRNDDTDTDADAGNGGIRSCSAEVKVCADGVTTVNRNPSNNCKFFPCPLDDGGAATTTGDAVVVDDPDNETVVTDGTDRPRTNAAADDDDGAAVPPAAAATTKACPDDTKLCPDGTTYVSRDPVTCEFKTCPPSIWGQAASSSQSLMTCQVCPVPDECVQDPDMVYPDSSNDEGITCGELEVQSSKALISMTGPTTKDQILYEDCAELQYQIAVEGVCGGCGTSNCLYGRVVPTPESFYGKFTSP